jgi:hypothetical protein
MFLAEGRPASAKENTMTRLGSQISCIALVLCAALLGCGSNAKSGGASSALDLIPASNAVAGWKTDNSNFNLANGPATATTQLATQALIDGASADFFAAPYAPVLFAWQNYLNTSIATADTTNGTPDGQFPNGAAVTLYVLQMPSAAQASGLYGSLVNASLYAGKNWTEPSSPKVGTDSRIADTNTNWWINFYQGDFYVEVSMGPSYSPPPDYTPGNAVNKAAAFAFATAVAGKI